jgi:PTH2 family peptidyl-tRNA hydrolase
MAEYKQIIVLRKDLGMRKGKMVAQGAHASLKAVLGRMDDPRVKGWLAGPFAKVAVSVDSEEEFDELQKKALQVGLICEEIVDAGRTEFHGVPTKTALAIGPDKVENLDPITGHLKLL